MVEEQVDVEVVVADFEAELPADEGEPLAQFEQEAFELMEKIRLQLPLVERLLERQEIEDIGVLQRLPDQVGLGGGSSRSKLVTALPWRR